jgi:hypothetical protein
MYAMASPSWGRSFRKLDAWLNGFGITEHLGGAVDLQEIGSRPGHSYRNFQPFKSASGRLYAFHDGGDYTDIRIHEVWTEDDGLKSRAVTSDFYRTKEHYDGHANYSTYCPCYFVRDSQYRGIKGEIVTSKQVVMDHSFDLVDQVPWADVQFAPIAFNAFTYWAADTEFYVDTIDLSRIDEGQISLFDRQRYVVSRTIDQVRDVIDFDGWFHEDLRRTGLFAEGDQNPLPGISFNVRVLTEASEDRFQIGWPRGTAPVGRLGHYSEFEGANGWRSLKARRPWEEIAERKAGWEKNRPPPGADSA